MTKAYNVATDTSIKVSKDTSIFECGSLIGTSHKKYVIVTEDDKILGLIQGLDIIKYLNKGEISKETKAIAVMTSLVQIDEDATLEEVVEKMVETKVSQVQIGDKIIDKDRLLEYIYLNNK